MSIPSWWTTVAGMSAESFGRWHQDYEQGRPGWPREAVDVAGLPRSSAVLDLGPGTGKLTRVLVSVFARVVAVEPDQGMRAVLAPLCPAAEVLVGSAEEIPVADASVDGVFVAEAFHKFDADRSLREMARVLRPRGRLVLLWNLPAGETEPSIASAERLLLDRAPSRRELGYDPVDLDTERYASGAWRTPFAGSRFEVLREARLPHVQTTDREGIVSFFASMGWLANLPETERLPLLDEVRSLLPVSEYRRPWETRVHWTRLGEDA